MLVELLALLLVLFDQVISVFLGTDSPEKPYFFIISSFLLLLCDREKVLSVS